MKIYIIIMSLVLFAAGCSQSNKPEDAGEGEIWTVGSEYSNPFFSYDEDTLQINAGIRDNKLGVKFYDSPSYSNKTKPRFEWTGNEYFKESFSKDIGYGDKINYKFPEVKASGVGDLTGNKYIMFNITYKGYDKNNNNSLELDSCINRLVLLKPNEKFIALENRHLPKITRAWWANTFIVRYHGDDYCFDDSGVELFKFAKSTNDYTPVSGDAGISKPDKTISRVNLRSGDTIWESTITIPGIPEDARYNKFTIQSVDNNSWIYSVNVTLNSGEIIIKGVSVNIISGEVLYLQK